MDIVRQKHTKQNKMLELHPKKFKKMYCKSVYSMKTHPLDSKCNNTISPLNRAISHQQAKQSRFDISQSITTTRTHQNINHDRSHRSLPSCSKFAVLVSVPFLVLLLIALASLFVGLMTMNKTTTTTTTTGTTTTLTTSTSTTTTTGTTSSTSTSASSTSSTSTTSITTTSVTTTSTTSTTTTTTTTSTTANPCGTPTSIGTSSSIYSATSGGSSYNYSYVSCTASTTGTVNLVFQFRDDPGNWYMDDVSVSNGTSEMLSNGGFESGSFSPGWIESTPNGAYSITSTGATVIASNSLCRSGSYCLSDGCGGVPDQISQSFTATAGQVYFISFWLEQVGITSWLAPVISVNVTIS